MRNARHFPLDSFRQPSTNTSSLLVLAMIMMGAAALCILFLVAISAFDWGYRIERAYLIPWVLLTGVAFSVPLIVLYRRNEFHFANPVVLPTFLYFIPAFFLGGWSLTFGLSDYFYLNYVSDPTYNFPLAFVYIIVAFSALAIGYFLPLGRSVGKRLEPLLPKWDFSPAQIVVACGVFLLVGYSVNIVALEFGQIGYQNADLTFGATGSLTYFLTLTLPASTFLLWVAFFRLEKWGYLHFFILAAQAATVVFTLVLSGGKGSLLNSAVMAIGAFVLTRENVRFKHWMVIVAVGLIAVIAGTIYGTKFRELKGNANRISIGEYSSIAAESIETVGTQTLSVQVQQSFFTLANRLETVSALAVVISNYEALAPYEAAYGLENNIWTYTWTAFVPRILWEDKPIVFDGYSYNELYFDSGGSGLSLTVMGDLLRNFGPIGVPIGMLILGLGIRSLYTTFVEGQPFSAWRTTVYFVVLNQITYDGFYGMILQNVVRTSFVIAIQIVIMRLIIGLLASFRRS